MAGFIRSAAASELSNNPMVPDMWPYAIAPSQGKGRGAFAKRDIAAGEVVALEAPTTIVRALEKGDERKAFCGRCLCKVEDGRGVRCEGCGATTCSEACRAAWYTELHTPAVCGLLRGLRQHPEYSKTDDEELEGVELLVQLQCLRDNVARPYAGGYCDGAQAYREVLTLCHDESAADEARRAQFRKTVALYRAVATAANASPIPDQEAYEILVRDLQNGLNLTYHTRGDSMLRGGCTLPRIAMFNHACYPNCARIDYIDSAGHEALNGAASCSTMIRALEPIPEGTELFISYTPIAYQSAERKEHLVETYKIACECQRCQLEDQMEEEQEGEECGEADDEDEEHCHGDHDHDHHHHDHHHHHGDDDLDMSGDDVSPLAIYNVFTARYICPDDECTGTLVPMRDTIDGSRRAHLGDFPGPPRAAMECNTCYRLRTEEEFEARLNGEDDDCEDECH